MKGFRTGTTGKGKDVSDPWLVACASSPSASYRLQNEDLFGMGCQIRLLCIYTECGIPLQIKNPSELGATLCKTKF
jgi:hypothetical protein